MIGGASALILHFNINAGSCPAVQFRVNYKNGGISYRSARDGYGFELGWSDFYTTTRKPSAGDVGAYTRYQNVTQGLLQVFALAVCHLFRHGMVPAGLTGQVMSLIWFSLR